MENHVYSMELNREYPRVESGKGITCTKLTVLKSLMAQLGL